MELKLNTWKLDTAPIVNHEVIAEYIQDTATKSGIESCILYNTRVEQASKIDGKWHLQTKTLDVRRTDIPKQTINFWVSPNPL